MPLARGQLDKIVGQALDERTVGQALGERTVGQDSGTGPLREDSGTRQWDRPLAIGQWDKTVGQAPSEKTVGQAPLTTNCYDPVDPLTDLATAAGEAVLRLSVSNSTTMLSDRNSLSPFSWCRVCKQTEHSLRQSHHQPVPTSTSLHSPASHVLIKKGTSA